MKKINWHDSVCFIWKGMFLNCWGPEVQATQPSVTMAHIHNLNLCTAFSLSLPYC